MALTRKKLPDARAEVKDRWGQRFGGEDVHVGPYGGSGWLCKRARFWHLVAPEKVDS